jgi:MarR family transcriptional regulator, 2-MHQ and catechol-resistance regulon repressor
MSNFLSVKIAPDFEKRYPDSSAKATECAMNLVLTADLLEKRIASLLLPFDLSPATGLVLSILADSEEPVSPNNIADRLIISRASVTSLLDSLEKRGYVTRQPHPTDRRMILVELTETGRQVADRFRPVVHHNQNLWLNVLNEEEQEQLVGMLQRIQESFMDSNS